MKRKLLALVAAAIVLSGSPAGAWNDTGHMIVAQIAFERLTPKAKAEVERLVALQIESKADLARTPNFIMAACWADDIRGAGDRSTETWHYTNMHHSPDGTPLGPQPPDNVETAIEKSVATLKDKNATDPERARALRLLLHWVGDVHQPLHTGSRFTKALPMGDRGGNGFRIAGNPGNLHSLWDQGMGLMMRLERPLTKEGSTVIQTLANTIVSVYPAEKLPEAKDQTFHNWVKEGHELSTTTVYSDITEMMPPSESYLWKNRPIALKRLALAGYRLGDLLNSLFN